jgi:DMSO/TMAO reductase YedYZ molybdopterin-dependent catalytic subunit
MADPLFLTRRAALFAGFGAAGYLVANASSITQNPAMVRIFEGVEDWTRVAQRALQSANGLAPEYRPADISPVFKANGTLNPNTNAYNAHVASSFQDWRLTIKGMIQTPMSLSMADIHRLPAKSQITKHDCVEGWTAIGMWTGVPLRLLLTAARVSPKARYVVFRCADNLTGEPAKGGEQSPGQYYESIAIDDAFHPQTLIAYALNGHPLDVQHGAPLRLRVERQLGYKHAKYIESIELTDSFAGIAGGKGGYWEDRGYEWYAGI